MKKRERLLIIAYDGLEHDLVEKYDLNCLKQKEYGKVIINTGILSSPTIWTTFITGLLPSEHGVVGLKVGNPALDKLYKLMIKLKLDKVWGGNQFLYRAIQKTMGVREDVGFQNIRGKLSTFFCFAQNPVDISVPCYSDMSTYNKLRHGLATVLGNPIAEEEYLKNLWQIFREKREITLRELSKDWDLFMVHFFLSDLLQHLRWYKEEQIQKLYKELEETTRLFYQEINEDETIILIISDHGMKKGLHSLNGFYSCNRELKLENPKITDFYGIIREHLGAPSKSDIAKIKERLRRLGYF